MAASTGKYDKHFISNPLVKSEFVKWRIICQGGKTGFGGFMQNFFLRWNCITRPISMEESHAHDFDEIFHFFGANSEDISDFDAVIELTMGPEKEIHPVDQGVLNPHADDMPVLVHRAQPGCFRGLWPPRNRRSEGRCRACGREPGSLTW